MSISLGILPKLIPVFTVLIIAIVGFFSIRGIMRGRKKFWLTGALVASSLWTITFIVIMAKILSSNDPLAFLGFLLPALPVSIVLIPFLSGNNYILMVILSNLLNLMLVFCIGALFGRLVEKIASRNSRMPDTIEADVLRSENVYEIPA